MATIVRNFVSWTGAQGLPGVSVWYATSATTLLSDLATFYGAIKSLLPPTVSIQVAGSGDTLNDANGVLTGSWSASLPAAIVGTGASGAYPAGVGGYINWRTSAIIGRRRLQGRTFICPLIQSAYQSDGTLAPATVTTLASAAGGIVTGANTLIWHRPTPGGSDGSSSLITGNAVPDQVTSLRSRRR